LWRTEGCPIFLFFNALSDQQAEKGKYVLHKYSTYFWMAHKGHNIFMVVNALFDQQAAQGK